MHPRQTLGIPAVRFHPFAWLPRDHRRRHNGAIVFQSTDLPIQSIPGRPGLIAKMQDLIAISQPTYQFGNCIRRCVVLTEIADLAPPTGLGYATAFLVFAVSIPTNASPCFFMARPLCVEDGVRPIPGTRLNPHIAGRAALTLSEHAV
jgi:hypothetical protein